MAGRGAGALELGAERRNRRCHSPVLWDWDWNYFVQGTYPQLPCKRKMGRGKALKRLVPISHKNPPRSCEHVQLREVGQRDDRWTVCKDGSSPAACPAVKKQQKHLHDQPLILGRKGTRLPQQTDKAATVTHSRVVCTGGHLDIESRPHLNPAHRLRRASATGNCQLPGPTESKPPPSSDTKLFPPPAAPRSELPFSCLPFYRRRYCKSGCHVVAPYLDCHDGRIHECDSKMTPALLIRYERTVGNRHLSLRLLHTLRPNARINAWSVKFEQGIIIQTSSEKVFEGKLSVLGLVVRNRKEKDSPAVLGFSLRKPQDLAPRLARKDLMP